MNTERSPLQERLGAAVAAVTPEVDADAVLHRVEDRRVERRRAARRQRRARRAIASGALAAACVAGVVLTTRPTQELRTVDAADPGPAPSVVTSPTERDGPTTGAGEAAQIGPVDLPGSGPRVTVVATAAEGFWMARGEALDGRRTGPDTVTWIGHDGSVGPTTTIRGLALTGAADEDHLWFLAREATDLTAPGALRLKQVDRSSGTLLASHDVPLDEPPVGLRLEGTNVRVHGAARELLLDRTGAVVDDRAATNGSDPPRQVLASSTELAGLDPSESVVSAADDRLWVLRGTTVRPVPRDR